MTASMAALARQTVGQDIAAADQPRWYLIQTRPRQADRAEENLLRQGYLVYHPRFAAQRLHRGRRIEREESLFPNYLFIRLQRWVDNWYPLRSTRGVARLVTFGQDPLPVADPVIDEIRRRVDRQHAEPAHKPGDQVRIIDGPFAGLDAIFQTEKDEQRALLLIDFLHRQVTVQLPLSSIHSAP
jgi:transcriptional antiterminator RfaH